MGKATDQIMPTENEKRAAGQWYTCHDAELADMQHRARMSVHQHNTMTPDKRGPIAPELAELLAHVGQDVWIESPFHCAYGAHIHLSDRVYMNAGCKILDTADVRIGPSTMLGPNVQIYCAHHHTDADKRSKGLEIARPVTIGAQVWIGGGAIILPGVTIGDGAIVGAGSVVTKNVPPGATVVGNPARVMSE